MHTHTDNIRRIILKEFPVVSFYGDSIWHGIPAPNKIKYIQKISYTSRSTHRFKCSLDCLMCILFHSKRATLKIASLPINIKKLIRIGKSKAKAKKYKRKLNYN